MIMKCIVSILLLNLFIYHALSASADKPLVVASASIWADMTEALAGDFVHVDMIVPIGGDPHIYEPTPSDALLVAKADLVLRNGLTFEGWLNELIDYSGTHADQVLVTDGIQPITSLVYQNAPDPHAWMDPMNALIYIENIKNALLTLLPQHADEIKFNYQIYREELYALDTYIRSQIDRIPFAQRVLITSHDAFQYYGRRYGLRLESVLGTSTDAQAQTSDITRLTRVIDSLGIRAVFIETTVNPKLLQQIAHDRQIKIGGKLYADSLGDRDSPASTFLDMLKYNTDVIVAALLNEPTPNHLVHNNTKQNSIPKWIRIGVPILFISLFVQVLVIRSGTKS